MAELTIETAATATGSKGASADVEMEIDTAQLMHMLTEQKEE